MLHATKQETVAERFTNLFERFEQSETYHIDAAKLEISEQIYLTMEQQGVSKAELARRLGKSRAYITKVLQGSTNFTLESLIRVARALDCQLDLQFSPRHKASELDELWEAGRRSASHSKMPFRPSSEYIKLIETPLRVTTEIKDAPIAVAA
ncbi:MAG TPA: helix-turn-helix transcriptional regulator [Pyrinomonadaceae bacterium]|jgi:transcriptional regulator with XRE-family HTH domain